MQTKVDLLLHGTVDDYVAYVEQYKDNPAILANAESIKQCVDSKLTKEDKDHATSLVVSPCVSGEGRGLCFSPTLKLLCESGNGTHLMEDVRRMPEPGMAAQLSQARLDPSRSGLSISLFWPSLPSLVTQAQGLAPFSSLGLYPNFSSAKTLTCVLVLCTSKAIV